MTDAPQPATGADATKKVKPAKEKKPPKEKKVPKVNPDGVVYFGKDKEGKKYGPQNNPKRPGTATYERFAKYKEGMKVKDICKIDGGPRMADITWDVDEDRRFIEVR